MTLTGFLKFPQWLFCGQDVLGAELTTKIGDINVKIVFPKMSDKQSTNPCDLVGLSNPLIAPNGAEKWKDDGEPLRWGYPVINDSEVFSDISMIVLLYECNNENEIIDISKKIYGKIDIWRKSFLDYCYVSTAQRSYPIVQAIDNSDFQLYGTGYIPKEQLWVFSLDFRKKENALTLDRIKEACEFASSAKELYLEYQMLLSAYNAKSNNKNREVVIDACSALEIVLVKQIEKYCDSIHLLADILFDKYRSLGERLKLITTLYPLFPYDYKHQLKPKITDLRNDIAHNKKVYPNSDETNELLSMVEKCMAFFFEGYYPFE